MFISLKIFLLGVVTFYKSQVHAIVNFTRNTTTSIKKYGNIIYVDIYDYVKGEEHDANRLFTGTLLQQYFVYIDNVFFAVVLKVQFLIAFVLFQ